MVKNVKNTISVFGLGYVGCVSIACLSKSGYKVIGVDSNNTKVDLINRGIPTIVEPGLDDLIKKGSLSGNITATNDPEYAINNSNIIIITVGTPSFKNGELDLTHVYSVAETIGHSLKSIDSYLTIAIRSTIKPGTCDYVKDIIEKKSGKLAGKDFSVVANPEFLREGTAINDYENPPYVLIGSDEPKSVEVLSNIYNNVNAEILHVTIKAAEIIKYINNTWHALKVVFGNEVGSICKNLNINSHEVIELFCKDTILNISPYYLRPGFAFGGACLPKDLSAFVELSKSNKVDTPLIASINASNTSHINRAIDLIRSKAKDKKIGILGLSFKNNTDDVRNSPIVEIAKKLDSEGYNFRIFDDYVSVALATGRNASTTRSIIGTLEKFLVNDPQDIIKYADVIVIAKKNKKYLEIIKGIQNMIVIDLVHMNELKKNSKEYFGLAW